MDCKLNNHLLTSPSHRDVTYQIETKGTSLFKRHGNWEFVALSGERGGGCAHVPVPTERRKGKEEGRGGEDEATERSPLSPPHLVALRVLA